MTLLPAIIGHLVGDYLLQNDWLANNKKLSGPVCWLHCIIWTTCVTLFSGWWTINVQHACKATCLLFAAHWIQDHTDVVRIWMLSIGQHKFSQPPMAPWSIIAVDNVWHIVQIWFAWRFIMHSP